MQTGPVHLLHAFKRTLTGALVLASLVVTASCGEKKAADAAAVSETAVEAPPSSKSDEATISADPGQLVYCDVVAVRTTVRDCDYFTRLEEASERGVGAFSVPDRMSKGVRETLILSVSFATPEVIRDYEQAMTEAPAQSPAESVSPDADPLTVEPGGPLNTPLPGPAATVDRETAEATPFIPIVGRHMRAKLEGRDFAIKPISPELQEVPVEGETVWQWEVTPQHQEAGNADLLLTTSVVAIAPDGTERILKRTTRKQTIAVEVGLIDQVEDVLKATPKWLEYLAAIGAGLGALFAAWKWLLPALRKSGETP